jgi:hypothetical protein
LSGWLVAAIATACAGPDPGVGGLEPAGTLVPPEVLACHGDRDGAIAASELPLLAGMVARQRTYEDVAVLSAGVTDDDGLRWDMPEGGRVIEVRTEPIEDQWFAASFPDATYAVPVDPARDPDDQVLGIYRVIDDEVLLLGTASRHPDRPAGGLLMPYDDPPVVLGFPVELGDSWEVTARVSSGTLAGAPFSSEDTYRIAVDARGSIHTPDAVIRDALRLRIALTIRTAAAEPIDRLELVWYRECLGEVARMTAHDGDAGPELDSAAGLRVLAF